MKRNIDKKDIVSSLRKKSENSILQNKEKADLLNKISSQGLEKNKFNLFWRFISKSNYTKFASLGMVLLLSLGSLFIFTKPQRSSIEKEFNSPVLESFKTSNLDKNLKQKEEYKERALDREDAASRLGLKDMDAVYDTYPELDRGDTLNSAPIIDKQPSVRQQVTLRGGETDDNANFEEYKKYILAATKGSGYDINLSQRFLIEVVDRNGKGLLGESILVNDNSNDFRLVTDSDGKVYFYPLVYRRIYDHNFTDNKVRIGTADTYLLKVQNKEFKFSTQDKIWRVEVDRAQDQSQLNLDLVFIIDTTGSMSDQINKLKETVQSISQRVSELPSRPKIRYGMVLYKDKSDEYLTRIYDLTSDLNQFQKNLNSVYASGGGDYPEDVNTALSDALEQLSWDQSQTSIKLSFLIADAPPHMDYNQQYDYRVSMLRALEKGIKIFPLASSGLDNTEGEFIFRQIALITNAKYLFITDAKGGTDYHVGEQEYSVDKLDSLIVKLIQGELQSVR